MADKTPVEQPLDADFNEEEQQLLESHYKKNAATEPQQFTTLYYLIASVTTLTVMYLFLTVLDMSPLDPLNALLYVAALGGTVYFLAESYQQAYEQASQKGMHDTTGTWIRDLEARTQVRSDSIKDKTKLQGAKPVAKPRTAAEIFRASGTGGEWRDLNNNDRRHYADLEAVEEVTYLTAQVADLRHFQYQKAMGWALLLCNAVFLSMAVLVSQLMLRNYDTRINLLVSTVVVGLITSLFTKSNDDAAAAKKRN